MIATSITDELIFQEAWLDNWDQLFNTAPKKQEERKKELTQKPGESSYKFSYRLLYSYLVSKGMREIGQFQEMDWDEEFLGSVIFNTHFLKGTKYATAKGGFNLLKKYLHYSDEAALAQMKGMCQRAARWALKNFNAEVYKKKQERGRKGGLAFRKWDLEKYLSTYDLPATKAAEVLGVHRNTITNMRKHFAEEFDISTGEVHGD